MLMSFTITASVLFSIVVKAIAEYNVVLEVVVRWIVSRFLISFNISVYVFEIEYRKVIIKSRLHGKQKVKGLKQTRSAVL